MSRSRCSRAIRPPTEMPRRIESAGCRVVQIDTGAGCRLSTSMIEAGLRGVAPPRASIVFVENVGNLVCPALFDLGEHAKMVIMSVTEGEANRSSTRTSSAPRR